MNLHLQSIHEEYRKSVQCSMSAYNQIRRTLKHNGPIESPTRDLKAQRKIQPIESEAWTYEDDSTHFSL